MKYIAISITWATCAATVTFSEVSGSAFIAAILGTVAILFLD